MNEDEMMEYARRRNASFGEAGTPIPVVDAADVKAVWEHDREIPEGIFVGQLIYEHICQPGANVGAVTYRVVKLKTLRRIVSMISPAKMSLLDENPEAVYAVTATIPLEWIGIPATRPPFDPEDYLRRIEESRT